MGFLGFGGNNNQAPNPNAPTTGQRLIGAGLTVANPILGMGYRLVTGYRNRNSVGGTYYGPMNRSGYTSQERAAIRNAPADQRQALMDMYRGDNTQTNTPLAAGMQQYQQGLGLDHTQNAMNAEANQGAVMDMPGAAGGVLQNMQQPTQNTQQQISQLPAAMQTWIRNNGLPQTQNDIRRATNAMYQDQSSNMAAANMSGDLSQWGRTAQENSMRQK